MLESKVFMKDLYAMFGKLASMSLDVHQDAIDLLEEEDSHPQKWDEITARLFDVRRVISLLEKDVKKHMEWAHE